VAEGEVVEALAPARGLGAVDVLQEADALDVLRARGRLDEPPGVVELRLDGDVRLRLLLLVLQPEDLARAERASAGRTRGDRGEVRTSSSSYESETSASAA
jgi:hypothetical protein